MMGQKNGVLYTYLKILQGNKKIIPILHLPGGALLSEH